LNLQSNNPLLEKKRAVHNPKESDEARKTGGGPERNDRNQGVCVLPGVTQNASNEDITKGKAVYARIERKKLRETNIREHVGEDDPAFTEGGRDTETEKGKNLRKESDPRKVSKSQSREKGKRIEERRRTRPVGGGEQGKGIAVGGDRLRTSEKKGNLLTYREVHFRISREE